MATRLPFIATLSMKVDSKKKRLFYLNPAPAKHIRDGTGRVVRQHQEERVPDILDESDESHENQNTLDESAVS